MTCVVRDGAQKEMRAAALKAFLIDKNPIKKPRREPGFEWYFP
jgi:hypothetical protein